MVGRFVFLSALGILLAAPALSQQAPGMQGSRNVHVLSHMPMAHSASDIAFNAILDIEIEQELSRPYVYISQLFENDGFDVISVKDPEKAEIIYSWRIDDPELRDGLSGAFDGRYFKLKGRYYYAQSFQYMPGGPDVELGAIVLTSQGSRIHPL